MASGKHIIKYYLDAVKEAKKAGFDDWEAARIAEQETKKKYGKLPKEGKGK